MRRAPSQRRGRRRPKGGGESSPISTFEGKEGEGACSFQPNPGRKTEKGSLFWQYDVGGDPSSMTWENQERANKVFPAKGPIKKENCAKKMGGVSGIATS